MPYNQACHIHTWLVIELVKLIPSLQKSAISHSQDHKQDGQESFKTQEKYKKYKKLYCHLKVM
jgi:hypothetical protein